MGFFFFWPRHTARGILVPQPGIEPVPPELGAQSLNHWTAREVPPYGILNKARDALHDLALAYLSSLHLLHSFTAVNPNFLWPHMYHAGYLFKPLAERMLSLTCLSRAISFRKSFSLPLPDWATVMNLRILTDSQVTQELYKHIVL